MWPFRVMAPWLKSQGTFWQLSLSLFLYKMGLPGKPAYGAVGKDPGDKQGAGPRQLSLSHRQGLLLCG